MPTWRPSTEDIVRVLAEQNPWHVDRRVPETFAPPVERTLVEPLLDRVIRGTPRRFQVVLGPRRVGKTTVMYHLAQRLLTAGLSPRRLWWHRLDHPLLMEVRLGDLLGVTRELAGATVDEPAVVMLDEVVYARDWDLWLKTFYDEGWPVVLVATSSASAALRDRRTESGVGRWEEQYLTPYLVSECMRLRGERGTLPVGETLRETLDDLAQRPPDYTAASAARHELFHIGGFPELLGMRGDQPLDERAALLGSQRTLRSDAVERAVYKDIPQSFGIDNPLMLERVLYVLAAQMTGVLSPTNIAQDLGLSQPTLDRYVSYLEQAFILFVLPNFSGRESSVQRRGRKIYFVDGAVRNAALQRGTAPLDNPTELGGLRENMAATHLHALAQQSQVRLFHWRAGRYEVDLVYDHPDQPLAFEIASSVDHSRASIRTFVEQHPRFRDAVYLVAPGAPAVRPAAGGGVGQLPLDLFLWAVSAQAERAAHENLTRGLGPRQAPLF